MKAVNMSKYRRVYGDSIESVRNRVDALETGEPITELSDDSRETGIASIRANSRATSRGGHGLFGRRATQ